MTSQLPMCCLLLVLRHQGPSIVQRMQLIMHVFGWLVSGMSSAVCVYSACL